MSVIASQITSLAIVYPTVYSGANQRKHQSSASLAFVRRIIRGPVNSPHKWPVTRKMFPFDDVIMVRITVPLAHQHFSNIYTQTYIPHKHTPHRSPMKGMCFRFCFCHSQTWNYVVVLYTVSCYSGLFLTRFYCKGDFSFPSSMGDKRPTARPRGLYDMHFTRYDISVWIDDDRHTNCNTCNI